jgi:TolB-like protein/DNA-binding winged helix-turn-helix (wHTH) protein/Tfp pilus assembly protein PilF
MSQQAQPVYEFGPYRLNPAQQLLLEGKNRIPLTSKAFQTLLVLVEAHGQVVTKEELLQKVWPGTFIEEATLAQNVFTLRKQLRDDGKDSVYIQTIPKRGYRFVAPVGLQEIGSNRNPAADVPRPASAQVSWRTRPIALMLILLLIVAGIAGYWLIRARTSVAVPTSRLRLAVLPVQNLTGDATQDYISEGLTEEVITELGNLNPERLRVIARTSSMAYKQSNKTVQEIAHELGVDYVLESSLREGSGQVRFTTQLIRTQDQTHVWAHNYDRPMADALALQVELAKAVADEIRVELRPQAEARLASRRPTQPEAYDAYLKGRFFWNKRTPESMKIALTYFQRATEADPNFALAYTGLADTYQIMVNLAQIDPEKGFSRARAAAQKALELDNSLAEAHTSLASIKGDFDWDWTGAEAEYQQALELNSNYATAHHWYGEFLAGLGRFDDAMAEIQKAYELDPLSPVIGVTLGQMYCRKGQCAQGIEQLQKTLEIDPGFSEAHEALSEIYGHLGNFEQALAELERGQSTAEHQVFLRGYAAARAGRETEAQAALRQFQTQPSLQHRDYYLAILYTVVRNKDQAFVHLERARQSHDSFMPYFRAEFVLESLRSDPRYAKLSKQMNMPT